MLREGYGTLPSRSNLPWWEHGRREYTEIIFIWIQEGEATRILCKYHANGGDEHDPLVVFEMAQIRQAIRVDRGADAAASWAALVSTPGNRKRMMIVVALAVFSQWRYVCCSRNFIRTPFYLAGVHVLAGERPTFTIFVLHSGNGLVSYYIRLILAGVGVDDLSTQGAIIGGLQVWKSRHAHQEFHSVHRWATREPIFRLCTFQIFNLFAAMLGASLVDRFGRKTLFVISNTGMLISKSQDTGWHLSIRSSQG